MGHSSNGITDRYLDLVRRFPLRSIRDDEELDGAIAVVDRLVDRMATLAEDERDYLEALSTFVERYESERHPIRSALDAEMLRHLLEARDLTPTRLAAESGIDEGAIAEILDGNQRLSREQIDLLAIYFHVTPAVFL